MKNIARLTAIAIVVFISSVTMSGMFRSDGPSASGKANGKQPPASHPLTGIWQQKMLSAGTWQDGGIEEVTTKGDQLRMLPLSHIPTMINSRGISNVQHILDIWTFDSDWGDYGIGNFQLTRETDDRYVGYAYQGGVRLNANVWTRIATPAIQRLATENGHVVDVFESGTSWYLVNSESGYGSVLDGVNKFELRDSLLSLTLNSSSKREGSPPRSAAHWVIPKSKVADIKAVRITLNTNDRR
jgi:hypothetical protein